MRFNPDRFRAELDALFAAHDRALELQQKRAERDMATAQAKLAADPTAALTLAEVNELGATGRGQALLADLRAGRDVVADAREFLAMRRELLGL